MTLNGHFTLYDHYYELPLTHYLLLIYCRLFITRDVTSGEVREAAFLYLYFSLVFGDVTAVKSGNSYRLYNQQLA